MTNREFLAFMEDGGYDRPEFWLSDGWVARQPERLGSPLVLGSATEGRWRVFTLAGMRDLDLAEPVCHVSFYEADAFARWAGERLATEAEWETAAAAEGQAHRRATSWSPDGSIPRRCPSELARSPVPTPVPALRRRLGVDAKPLHAVPRFPPGRGSAGRI